MCCVTDSKTLITSSVINSTRICKIHKIQLAVAKVLHTDKNVNCILLKLSCLPLLSTSEICYCLFAEKGFQSIAISTSSCGPINPCQFGGHCLPEGEGYTCLCPEGRGGSHCERKSTICQTNFSNLSGGHNIVWFPRWPIMPETNAEFFFIVFLLSTITIFFNFFSTSTCFLLFFLSDY